jgi:hypothetical protein
MKFACIALVVALLSVVGFGQNPNVPSGQISFNALNGPFGSAGVDIFGSYGISTYGELREDNFLFPAANGSMYQGSYQYTLDKYVCPLVINLNINCKNFSTYVNAGAGVGRTEVGTTATNHLGGGFGFGVNWDPTGQGKFTVNLIDLHEERLAFDTVRGWTTIAAVGFKFGFGSNQLATAAKLERVRAQQAKRLKKMQERAAKANHS